MPEPSEILEKVAATVKFYANNGYHNVTHMLDGMNVTNTLRMVAIVCGYLLLRPYLMKLGAKFQEREHAKALATFETAEASRSKAAISPNSMRGEARIPDDTESEDDMESKGDSTSANWGKKARKRQRQVLRKVLEADEKLRLDREGDADDNDIMEYLEDYKEGWD